MEAKLEWARKWLAEPKRNYIGGEWNEATSGREWQASNPATGAALTGYRIASAEDVELAAAAGQRCHASGAWSRRDRRERARVLRSIGQLVRDHAAELATLETLANGKLFRESVEDDLPDSGDIFDYYAGWTDKHYGESCPVADGFLNYTVKEPVGVCGLIVPWNFPLLMACWKMAPALATGNSIVVKPSEYTSLTLVRLFELIDQKLDLPAGLVNLVLGDSETGAAISQSHAINKVSFTGSTEVGRLILQASAQSNLKTVTLEMGGKSPNIIFDDVPDLDFAIERSFNLMFSQKAEKCSEPTKFFVHRKHYDQFVEAMVSRAEAIRCGDPFDASNDQGAQCNKEQFDKIMSYVKLAHEEGRVVAGGKRDEQGENAKGFFVRPTVVVDIANDARVASEEIFGPVLAILPFEDEDSVVAQANANPYGLAAGLWTADVSRAHRVAAQLDAGMIFINRYGCYDFSSPFGGFKQSGWGKEMGLASLEEYTKTKSVWLKL